MIDRKWIKLKNEKNDFSGTEGKVPVSHTKRSRFDKKRILDLIRWRRMRLYVMRDKAVDIVAKVRGEILYFTGVDKSKF